MDASSGIGPADRRVVLNDDRYYVSHHDAHSIIPSSSKARDHPNPCIPSSHSAALLCIYHFIPLSVQLQGSSTAIAASSSMSQRIHLNPNASRAPMMGPGSGYTPDPVRPAGGRPAYNGGAGAGGGDDVLNQIKRVTSKVEDAIEAYSHVSGSS
jgi:hypothetical protein